MTTNMIIALISVGVLVILILSGIHISFSLAFVSFAAIAIISGGFVKSFGILSSTTFNSLRDYTFCVCPMFMLMGTLMARSGAAEDLFSFSNMLLRKVPGGLAIATVVGNAIFAAVTGISVASATVFSQVAVPEMEKFKYNRKFSVGCVAGTSTLGMLIPPSLLFIVYGTVTSVSIGKLFMAGVLPGVLLAVLFIAYIVLAGKRNPELIGRTPDGQAIVQQASGGGKQEVLIVLRALPIVALIVVVLGGIWGGFFTPTEASAIGAAGGVIIALCKGKMKVKDYIKTFADTARACAGILFLLASAQIYSRLLALSGLVGYLSNTLLTLTVPSGVIIAAFIVLTLLLGCILDSTSIILLTAPILHPVIVGMGLDPIWWAIVIVVAIEIGMLTPPFGIVVFAIKTTLGDYVQVNDIFHSSMPYIVIMLACLLLLIAFPVISTVLPNMM